MGVYNDKPNYYIIHKHTIIDCDVFVKEFEIDPSPTKLTL